MGIFLLSGVTLTIPASASAPTVPVLPSYPVTLTAYNAVPWQTDNDPFMTSSGLYSNPEIIVARSQDLVNELPFGTIIEIDGPSFPANSCGFNVVKPIVGYRIVADSMNARYTDRIDVLFDTGSNYTLADGRVKNAGTILGICNDSVVRVVGFIDISHLERVPETQAELEALVIGDTTLALK